MPEKIVDVKRLVNGQGRARMAVPGSTVTRRSTVIATDRILLIKVGSS
jgi:hypothetical protein